MAYRPIFWQILPRYLLLIVVALVAFYIYASRAISNFNIELTHQKLTEQSGALDVLLSERELSAGSIDTLCKDLGEKSRLRYTIILPEGELIGDSQEEISLMDPHHNREEVLGALAGRISFTTRFSNTQKRSLIYAARPYYRDGELAAIVRVATPLSEADSTLSDLLKKMFVAAIILGLLTSLVSFFISRKIGRSLGQMSTAANAYAQGDFSESIDIPKSAELADLAKSLNKMGLDLSEKIRLIQQERNEREAVLSSMEEGVLAVDAEGRIITINTGAAKLLGLRRKKDRMQPVHELVRNHHILNMIDNLLKDDEELRQDIIQHGITDTNLRIHGSQLRDANEERIGALLVIQDFTRLRKLEQMRSDFVANVSHELKTPITSIKGFVETLLDGALNEPEDAKHFLEIVDKQAERLNLIIDDLLILSRIEQDYETQSLECRKMKVKLLLDSVKELCADRAGKKNINIEIDAEPDLEAPLNLQLMEQALINLVNNGIKYSDENTTVTLSAFTDNKECVIQIRDQGWGISSEHLDRVFERFYRVDKARSRSLGGTGLGLAIVKHIIQAHGGLISVESTSDEGSTFSLRILLK